MRLKKLFALSLVVASMIMSKSVFAAETIESNSSNVKINCYSCKSVSKNDVIYVINGDSITIKKNGTIINNGTTIEKGDKEYEKIIKKCRDFDKNFDKKFKDFEEKFKFLEGIDEKLEGFDEQFEGFNEQFN